MSASLVVLAAALLVAALALALVKSSCSVQEFLDQWKREKDYASLFLRPEKLEIAGERGSETLAYFDSKAPRSQQHSGAPILFLHGFTADKETWLRVVGLLDENHRVVALDLAGHGGSSDAADDDYGRRRQAERAHELVAKLGIEHYHLLGHSMGGAVAMTHALAHPDEVLSLGLIAPAGLGDPHTAEFKSHLEAGVNPLIVAGNWNGSRRIRYVTNGPRALHFSVWLVNKHLTRLGLEREPLYREIFRQLSEEAPLSEDDLRQIDQPTFILWGSGDRVLKPEQADFYASHIPGTRAVEKWDGFGHTPSVEAHKETAQAYLAFLEGLTKP